MEDLRRFARRRLPRGIFDYIDGGAEDERTLADNSAAFARIRFRPRVLREVGDVDPSTMLLGRPLPYPLVLAPTGYTRVADPQGELAVARAADRADLPYALSTMATRSIEEVAAVSGGRKWFQVYTFHDHGLVKDMIARAAEAGYEAIMPTVAWPCSASVTTTCGGASRCLPSWASARSRRRRPSELDVGVRPRRADHVRQRRPAGVGGQRRAGLDGGLRQHEVRPEPVVARHRVDAVDLGRTDDHQGYPVRRGRRPRRRARRRGRRPVEPRRTATRLAPPAVDLIAPVLDTVATASRSSVTAGSGGGATSSRPLPSAPRRAWSAAPISTPSGRPESRGVDHVLRMFDADVRRPMALVGVRTIDELTRRSSTSRRGADRLAPTRRLTRSRR